MPPSAHTYRGLPLADILKLRRRDHRAIEVFVDCYGDSEAASALHCNLADALPYPFPAHWRDADGRRRRVTVTALADDWDDNTGLQLEADSQDGAEVIPADQVYGLRPGQGATVLNDYRAWWPYDLDAAADEDYGDD